MTSRVGAHDAAKREAGAPTRWSLGVFTTVLSAYLLTTNYRGRTIFDVYSSTMQAWGVGTTGTPWLELSGDPAAVKLAQESAKFVGVVGDHVVALRAVGTWIFGVPFYAVLGDPDSFSLAAGAAAAAVISALGVLWMYLALYRLVPNGYALAGSAVYAFGLPTWSVSADGLWGHTITQAALAGAALAAAKNRMWLAGLAFVPGILARAHVSIIAAVLGAGLALRRRSLRPLLAVGVPSAAGMGLLVALNGYMFGRPSIGGAYASPTARISAGVANEAEQLTFLENLAGFLVSPGRGILVYTPLLLILLPSAMRSWRSSPDWVRWLALGGLAYGIAQVWISVFNGGDAYSAYRLGLETVTCLVPLYTLAGLRASKGVAAAAAGVGVLQIWIIFFGAVGKPWIAEGSEWTDSDLLVAFRSSPVGVVITGAAFVTLALLAIVWVVRRHEPLLPAPVRHRDATPATGR